MIAVANAVRLPLADKAVDLVFGSPPYCDARTYGIGFKMNCEQWVTWMLDVTTEALRVCRGPVIWVAAGVTRDRCYWPACEGLMWEWWRTGRHLYRPCIFYRYGVPGSGGDDWFRNDYEYIMCFKHVGKLTWSNNTAHGHPPRWAPGGAMSYRLADGSRVNQWGGHRKVTERQRDGSLKTCPVKPSHRYGEGPPALANPGNVFKVEVGGGHLGSPIAHENEAPFPEKLAERFVLSCCPPGGIVCDPFSGSGTTKAVAQQHGRRCVAFDIRLSQCQLTRRRTAETQLSFAALEE